MPTIFNDINWVDIFFLILLLGMIYKGAKIGVGGQMISLVGGFILVFISIRYYILLSEAIFGFVFQNWARPISFLAIAGSIFMTIKLLERVFNISGGEELSALERIGGIFVASIKAAMLFGVVGILFLIIPVDLLRVSAREGSRTCMFFVKMDVFIYSGITGIIDSGKKVREEDVMKELLAKIEK
ncbi:MAG: CvpA family protein [Candidatus Omnitrophota bacterium]